MYVSVKVSVDVYNYGCIFGVTAILYAILVLLFNIYLIVASLSGALANVIVLNDKRKNIRFVKYICVIFVWMIIIFCIKMFLNYCDTYNQIGENTGIILDIKYIGRYNKKVGRKKFNVKKAESITSSLQRKNIFDIEISNQLKYTIHNDYFIDIIDINENGVIARICKCSFGEGEFRYLELMFDREYFFVIKDGSNYGIDNKSYIVKFHRK